ncbi:DUF5060 domain-containing protein [Paenibacillus sp. FSL L8-0340]|uniref:DUF5605 domain-containing protein n=1 Tax=Paenibacillus sp. FSL L8-0340 TaxID=2954685 RepID=UPI003158782D
MKREAERWGLFELELNGPCSGNPFVDVDLTAEFKYNNRVLRPDGFYDGEGRYKVRFMPDTVGTWTYRTRSNIAELNGISGEFVCVEAGEGNHGPVRVSNQYHFAYADGSPHFSFGTTCYAWTHQREELQEQTLATLKSGPFNKIRMCIFPKHYDYNLVDPADYAFQGSVSGGWDFRRFNHVFFANLERRILDLQQLGIEADIILFHPYDRWGFSSMDRESDDFYLRYVVARLAAFRNIWWSMANEHDLMRAKKTEDWDHYFQLVQELDPYQHLRSNHNWQGFYDHGKPWVTHCSIQHPDLLRVKEWRNTYRKPVLVDECCYEGNINHDWGNITAQELVRRFWEAAVRGGYAGHGETYVHPGDILWWSHGGELHGDSAERISFLRSIMEEGPEEGIDPLPMPMLDGGAGKAGEYYLYYYGNQRPAFKKLILPPDHDYRLEIIDTWNMTITAVQELVRGDYRIELPNKQYMALRITVVN